MTVSANFSSAWTGLWSRKRGLLWDKKLEVTISSSLILVKQFCQESLNLLCTILWCWWAPLSTFFFQLTISQLIPHLHSEMMYNTQFYQLQIKRKCLNYTDLNLIKQSDAKVTTSCSRIKTGPFMLGMHLCGWGNKDMKYCTKTKKSIKVTMILCWHRTTRHSETSLIYSLWLKL